MVLKQGKESPFKNALVIEDLSAEELGRGLTQLGVKHKTVSYFAAAERIIEAAKPGDFDVIFLDHNMPKEDPGFSYSESVKYQWAGHCEDIGYTLITRMRQKLPKAVLIGTSGAYEHVTPEFLRKEFGDAPDHIIEKNKLKKDPAQYLKKELRAAKKSVTKK